jgi:hypothetical protein
MAGDEAADTGQAGQPAISDTFRVLLEEFEAFLDPLPEDELSEHILPLASSWVLNDAGFDIERHTEEARQFVEATPEHDRVLRSFPGAVSYFLALRLTMSADDALEPGAAQGRLERARAALEERARLVEADCPMVARGFRLLLEETAGARPPDDRLWRAMALRIGERVMPRPGWSS